jgi:uncharacterized membrane protein
MRSKVAIAGHPIHAILVTIPIGLFVAALVADLAYVASDEDKMWYDIAFWAGNAAIVTALLAAVAGLADYLLVVHQSDAKTIGMAHAALNVTVVALFAVAAALMADEGALNGGELTAVVVLHAAGVGLLLLSGWLGGEMVYRHHIGMIPDDMTSAEQEEARHAAPGQRVVHR